MSLLDMFLVRATVAAVETFTPRMRRISVVGDSLRGMNWQPGQHIRVRVDDVRLRSYTIWDFSGGRLDLCVLDHPAAGPGVAMLRALPTGAAHGESSRSAARPTGCRCPAPRICGGFTGARRAGLSQPCASSTYHPSPVSPT